MTQPEPLTEQQLDEIETRAAHLHEYAPLTDVPLQADADQLTGEDVPALVAEIRRKRTELADSRAENAKLARWHREDETALAGMRDTIEYRRAEQAARTVPDARARRDAEVMRRCAAFVRDTYDGEWASDAAATLERDADVTEHGCPGYEDAGRGDTVAERQLANCKHCGRPRAVCVAAPAPTPAPLAASHGPAGAREGEAGAEGAAGRVGDSAPTGYETEISVRGWTA